MATSLQKQILREGDNTNYPKKGDIVIMEYTGWLYDPNKPNNRGEQFDSSVGRGDFKTAIGVKKVIEAIGTGWDEGVPTMSLGEKAVLTIPGAKAYGSTGFPGLIPPNATLIFEVHLKKIN
ncbi:hypothetical protein H2198_010323 [Neophaeococcomyces mojaviensis]|uniref:Uncharacterized protein n=1 Tax=Neophaeococcomyces mojaviensis TaxID=3383035 RepID=A0ACC2ZS00_9EURO|nr:hypothetical protein H2198_010323 [Knufia sp. JES_112]